MFLAMSPLNASDNFLPLHGQVRAPCLCMGFWEWFWKGSRVNFSAKAPEENSELFPSSLLQNVMAKADAKNFSLLAKNVKVPKNYHRWFFRLIYTNVHFSHCLYFIPIFKSCAIISLEKFLVCSKNIRLCFNIFNNL